MQRAQDLGWSKASITVIDQDQGRSGSSAVDRDGFQFLIARHTGHDADHEPDYLLASPFVRLGEEKAA